MTTKEFIQKAEELSKAFSQSELIEFEEIYEDLFHTYYKDYYDPIRMDRCFEMLQLYNMALSMQDGVDPSYPPNEEAN